MTPTGVLVKALTDAGIDYNEELSDREATALRVALAPWIAWMIRPGFPAPAATYDVFLGGPKSGTVEQASGTPILGILGPGGRDSGWTQVGNRLVPPPGFSGQFPEWVYGMTHNESLAISHGGMLFWRDDDGTHSRAAS